jgi:hypothetical protein
VNVQYLAQLPLYPSKHFPAPYAICPVVPESIEACVAMYSVFPHCRHDDSIGIEHVAVELSGARLQAGGVPLSEAYGKDPGARLVGALVPT